MISMWTCDSCKVKHLFQKSIRYTCQGCDYDLCAGCSTSVAKSNLTTWEGRTCQAVTVDFHNSSASTLPDRGLSEIAIPTTEHSIESFSSLIASPDSSLVSMLSSEAAVAPCGLDHTSTSVEAASPAIIDSQSLKPKRLIASTHSLSGIQTSASLLCSPEQAHNRTRKKKKLKQTSKATSCRREPGELSSNCARSPGETQKNSPYFIFSSAIRTFLFSTVQILTTNLYQDNIVPLRHSLTLLCRNFKGRFLS